MHIISDTYLKDLNLKKNNKKRMLYMNEYGRDEMIKPMHNSRTNTYNYIKPDTRVIETCQCSQ